MIDIANETDEQTLFRKVENFLVDKGFTIADRNEEKPWGGYFVIDEDQSSAFIDMFFPDVSKEDFDEFKKLSPKILMVAPGKRLSWQYHHRRAEIWQVIGGKAGVIISETDEQTPVQEISVGDSVNLKQGQRHRLVGLDGWGVLAEIWKHTDPENPSDEEDIVRVEDDFGR